MRSLLIGSLMLGACSTMTLRAGAFVAGGKPAFQASIEVGPSVYRKHVGVSATSEYGFQKDATGSKGVIAVNFDTLVLVDSDDDDLNGPLVRTGLRFRGALRSQDDVLHDEIDAVMVRGAAYTTVERDHRGVTACGVEIAGGMTTLPDQKPAFEANLVVTSRWGMM